MLLDKRIDLLAQHLGPLLKRNSWHMVVAESCSGGKLASVLTQYPGSSEWFEYSIVSYSNYAKMHYLGVSSKTIDKEGPVSHECALEMVNGLINQEENYLGLAITGYAGPSGGTTNCPVGTVFLAWKIPGLTTDVKRFNFVGERLEIIHQSIFYALKECVLKSLLHEDIYALKYFFAIGCDDLKIQNLACKMACNSGIGINYLEPKINFHLTLVYLGQLSLSKIQEASKVGETLSHSTPSFSVNLTQLNYWANSSAYVLEGAHSKNLEELVNLLSHACQVQDKKSFKPHLTLSKKTSLIKENFSPKEVDINWKITHFSLYASFHGLFYIEHHRWNLKK